YYQFYNDEVAVDRYQLGDQYLQLLLAARELNPDKVPAQNWVNLKLQYTHGYGVVAARANQATSQGAPVLTIHDIPPAGVPQLTAQTQVLFNRAVQDRVSALAPFLQFDQDPYVAVVDGHVYWILDGFTVTDHYPYSDVTPDTNSPFATINYARNSVKVVVDAYEGTTTFYQIDPNDALANTYASIFPGL